MPSQTGLTIVDMKLWVFAAVLLALRPADVRFESEGIRVGNALVQGTVLEIRTAGASSVLASGSSLEALSTAIDVDLAPERTLTLEPGIRAAREEAGLRLTTHGSRKIRVDAGEESVAVESPVRVTPTADGWLVGEKALPGRALRVALQAQDDAGRNLERMLQARDQKSPGGVPKLSMRSNRIFHGDPLTGSQAADSISVRQLPQVTPSGGP